MDVYKIWSRAKGGGRIFELLFPCSSATPITRDDMKKIIRKLLLRWAYGIINKYYPPQVNPIITERTIRTVRYSTVISTPNQFFEDYTKQGAIEMALQLLRNEAIDIAIIRGMAYNLSPANSMDRIEIAMKLDYVMPRKSF